VLDIIIPNLQKTNNFLAEDLGKIAFDAAYKVASIAVQTTIFEAALAYLGLAAKISALFLGSNDSHDRYGTLIKHTYFQIQSWLCQLPEQNRQMITALAGVSIVNSHGISHCIFNFLQNKADQMWLDVVKFHQDSLEHFIRYVER
jgi:hypothetical protein